MSRHGAGGTGEGRDRVPWVVWGSERERHTTPNPDGRVTPPLS